MKRTAIIVTVMLLLAAGVAVATQGWQDDQDAQQFSLTNVSQVGIGTLGPSPSAALAVEKSQNSTLGTFVANTNAGTAAAATGLYQTDVSAAYGVPPWLQIGMLGLGYSDPLAVLDTPGAGIIAYNGMQGLVFDIGTTIGGAPGVLFVKHSGATQTVMGAFDWTTQAFSLPATLAGSGTRCLQADNTGTVQLAAGACGSGSGTVTSVTGTAGRITVTPSSPNPVVDLATFGSSPTCAWANVVVDAWGRTTCTANTAPQPAGSYITALTHDVAATGPGSATAEVIGITDGTSVDHPVAASAWTNGQAVALDGSGNIHTAAFQAPISPSTCGATTFGTSINSSGAISCSQPAFTDISGQWACAQSPAFTGSATKASASCATKVVALDETSGPTNLPIVGIAADQELIRNGSSQIEGRPRGQVRVNSSDTSSPDYLTSKIVSPAGSIVISAIAGNSLMSIEVAPKTSLSYFMNISALTVFSTGWIATNDPANFYGAAVEYPTDYIVAHVTVTANLITNGIPGGPGITVVATRNGSNIIGAVANFNSGTSTGVQTSGPIATGSASASDVYGLVWNSGPASGNITVSFALTMDAK